jgi:drug/metabolite transporter (DMT)-like permease
MPVYVFLLVIVAAACHAGWNAVVKLGLEPLTATALLAAASGVLALAFLPFTGLPPLVALPWLLGSVAVHFGYFFGLTEAYRAGDLGQVYPIARGAAPLFTAALSAVTVHERLGARAVAGVLCVGGGVLLLSLRGRGRAVDRRAVGFALFTALTITAYTVLDGIGARRSSNPVGYAATHFVADGVMLLVVALVRRGRSALASEFAQKWKPAFVGGAMSFASYGIAIWAMTVAPIALVAATRETSVLFGALIAVVVLREPLRGSRIGAAGIILTGLVLMRLG